MNTAPSQAPEDFRSRVRNAVFWRSGSQIVAQIVMWGATIIVVRLLDPHDYGLFAMTQVILVLFNFLNGDSFSSSLIQADSVDRKRIAQVFGMLILSNACLATAQILAAPLAAAYFRQPIVADMLRVQALLYLATPFISLPSALLARGLDFRKQAAANMAAAFAGATTALTCAYMGMGVWTLVYAPIALFGTRAIGLTYAARLLVWPSFNFRGAGQMFKFGGALLLCQMFWIIQSQSDIFIAGRVFDPHDLGLYAESLFLTLIFTGKFIPPLNEVAFPAYANLAKEGGDIGQAFITSARLTMFVAMPLYLGLSIVAEPMVMSLFGEKWHDMAPLVSGLALAMPCFALQILCSPATNALGKPHIYVRSSIAGAIIMPCAFIIGLPWGAQGLVHAWQVAAPALLLVTLALTLRAIGADWRKLVAALIPSILASGAMAVMVYLLSHYTEGLPPPAELAILVGFGAVSYFLLLWTFSRQTLHQIIDLVIRRKPVIS